MKMLELTTIALEGAFVAFKAHSAGVKELAAAAAVATLLSLLATSSLLRTVGSDGAVHACTAVPLVLVAVCLALMRENDQEAASLVTTVYLPSAGISALAFVCDVAVGRREGWWDMVRGGGFLGLAALVATWLQLQHVQIAAVIVAVATELGFRRALLGSSSGRRVRPAEAAVASQVLALAVQCAFTFTVGLCTHTDEPSHRERVWVFVGVAVLGSVFTAGTCLACHAWSVVGSMGLSAVFVGCLALQYGVMALGMRCDPLLWMHRDLDATRWCIIGAWIATLCTFFGVVHLISERGGARPIIIRKLFHFVCVAMFIPVYAVDPDFLTLAYAVGVAVLTLIEAVRITRMPPIGAELAEVYSRYVDSREAESTDASKASPVFILTPLYLLVGCSAPHWIIDGAQSLSPLKFAGTCGLIALGVGDAFAAVVGSSLGRHKWPGSTRTVEGSAACYASMVLFTVGCDLALHERILGTSCTSLWVGLALLLVTMLEGFTVILDNLVLPLHAFAMLLLAFGGC